MPISIGALRAASSRFVKTASNLAEARSLALQTVFLCHSHHDEQLVKGLMSLFREQGWRVYVDWEDAAMPETPTRETAARIQQKIRELDYFVFLATANSVKSRWCPWEIGFADSAKSLVPDILKIEDVNFIDSNSRKPFRQLFGYAISAKRYALYTKTGNDILIEKASGHGLGYLFAPKERKEDEESDEEEVPPWVIEAWDFLLRKELQLTAKEPSWLDSPAMMRMVVTTPNVLKNQRPEWLGPFNFFLFPHYFGTWRVSGRFR